MAIRTAKKAKPAADASKKTLRPIKHRPVVQSTSGMKQKLAKSPRHSPDVTLVDPHHHLSDFHHDPHGDGFDPTV